MVEGGESMGYCYMSGTRKVRGDGKPSRRWTFSKCNGRSGICTLEPRTQSNPNGEGRNCECNEYCRTVGEAREALMDWFKQSNEYDEEGNFLHGDDS